MSRWRAALACALWLCAGAASTAAEFTREESRLVWLTGTAPLFVRRGPAPEGRGELVAVAPAFEPHTRAPRFTSRKAGAYRIVCLGGSTTAGWPFQSVSYPRILELMLRDALSGKTVEVINAGVEASDSTADVRLVEQALEFEPDLLLVYEGRNERWNLPLHRGWRAAALRLHGRLLAAFGPYMRLSRATARWAGARDHAQTAREWAGISGGRSRNDVRALLIANLSRMADAARTRGVGMMVLTQAVSSEERSGDAEIVELNAWLREFASARKLALIDVERAFQAGKPESELIIPPPTVHPDIAGYVLLARTAARALSDSALIAPRGNWRLDRLRSDGAYVRQVGLSAQEWRRVYASLGRFFIDDGRPDVGRRYLEKARRRPLGSP